MIQGEQYIPRPAYGAQIRKDGEKWTLILVRELRHSPEKVWQALTDPAHLREWAPFRNNSDASRRSQGASVQLGWLRYLVGTRSLWWRHAPDAVDQHRSPLHRNGCCRVAHLFRCSGSPSQRNSHRPHRCWRGHEVRRLAATECRVRKAVWGDENMKKSGGSQPSKQAKS